MSYMEPEVWQGTWIEVESMGGESCWIPAYVLPGADPDSLTPEDVLEYTDAPDVACIERIVVHSNAIGVRLSASGYLDATDWSVHDTIDEARYALQEELEVENPEDYLPSDDAKAMDLIRVTFYRQRPGPDVSEWEREPVAVFPDIVRNGGMAECYVRVGQHGTCSIPYVTGPDHEETDDEDPETRSLADELERIGYSFVRRRTVWARADDGPSDPFEYENCAECGGGLEEHEKIPGPFDLPFYRCRAEPSDNGPGDDGPSDDGPGDDGPGGPPIKSPDALLDRLVQYGVLCATPPQDETRSALACPDCDRGLGDDYTPGCDECGLLQEEKRATDLAALEQVHEDFVDNSVELGRALTALQEARLELQSAAVGDAKSDGVASHDDYVEALDRVDLLRERVGELEAKGVALEKRKAELESLLAQTGVLCERCGDLRDAENRLRQTTQRQCERVLEDARSCAIDLIQLTFHGQLRAIQRRSFPKRRVHFLDAMGSVGVDVWDRDGEHVRVKLIYRGFLPSYYERSPGVRDLQRLLEWYVTVSSDANVNIDELDLQPETEG